MADAVTFGQFMKFLKKYGFVVKGKKLNRYKGVYNGSPITLTIHYHKDTDYIASGTLSQYARDLKISNAELIDIVKNR